MLETEIKRTVVEATVQMVQRGVREANRGRGYLGPALEWNRQNYSQRQASMIAAARSALAPRASDKEADICTAVVGGAQILFHIGAVPDSISVAAAREMVGQPHLADHDLIRRFSKSDGGPVHVIACHKGITEAQAEDAWISERDGRESALRRLCARPDPGDPAGADFELLG
jgi:hypothetical protein